MKTYQKLIIPLFVLFCGLCPRSASAQVKDTTFSFSIATASTTSAGVFTKNGDLVRTLWSLVKYSAGTFTERWDGLLDDGSPAPTAQYEIKVLSGNVSYQWEGSIIGNTSDAITGNTKLHCLDLIQGMAVSGQNIYYAAGYGERVPSSFRTTIANTRSKVWVGIPNETDQSTAFVCADANLVYWGGQDPIDPNNETFVYATKASDDSRAVFQNGLSASMDWGSVYQSTISYMNTPKTTNSLITGLAVQQTGSFLFVSRKGINQLQVLDKTTGALIKTIIISGAAAAQADNNNNLWLAHNNAVEKYRVNTDGSLTSLLTLPLTNVAAIAVSPDNSTVLVADIDEGQVKAFSNTTGAAQWTLGSTVSYAMDATVQNDKFYWKDQRQDYNSLLCFLPDGSFYVGDEQNKRVQHFGNNRSFIDNISYLPATYATTIDPNNPTRLFVEFLEFSIDYSKPLAKDNGSWTLVKNWGANIPANQYDLFEKMRYVVTLNNGHTYARLRRNNNTYDVMELMAGGTGRITASALPAQSFINKDGYKIISTNPAPGLSQTITRYALTGFSGNNDPVWSSSPEIVAQTPLISASDPIAWEGFRAEPFTSSNQTIFFDYNKSGDGHGYGYHLGAIKLGDNKWTWKTAKSTALDYAGVFPPDGAFDNGNTVIYPGGAAFVSDHNIFWGYHGEFWKQSQTNKWNHVYDNGLMVGQFGEISLDHPGEEAFTAGAGNAFAGGVVAVSGQTYLYHNDESIHAGVHRWKINGLSTIQVQTAIYPSGPGSKPDGIDLLAGLTRGGSLANNSFGWHRTPATDYGTPNATDYFMATTGQKSYDIFQRPDVFMRFVQASGTADVTRDLGNNSLVSWQLFGQINFEANMPNHPDDYGGSYMQVLDDQNLVIAQFSIQRGHTSGTDVVGNKQIIYHTEGLDLQVTDAKNQPIEINAVNGVITFKYANFTPLSITTVVDNAANWHKPTTLRFHFFTTRSYERYDRFIDIPQMRFSANTLDILLPTTFVSVTAAEKKPGIQVNWSVGDEINTVAYEVEKSLDGIHFQKVGRVPASSSGLLHVYTWNDSHSAAGNNFYRIKSVTSSGLVNYSQVVMVKTGYTTPSCKVFPDPLSGDFMQLHLINMEGGRYALKLLNNNGQIVYSGEVNYAGGAFIATIALPAIAKGIYHLHISGTGFSDTQKIIR